MSPVIRVALAASLSFAPKLMAAEWAYLRNDSVELGIRLDLGAGIGHFATRRDGRNLLNHYDAGRLIQQSWYGDPDGSVWSGRPWRWNPVQGGCWKGQASTVLESRLSDSGYYAKVRPRNWAGCEEIDGVMEEWIELRGPLARIRFRFANGSKDNLAVADQEMPALFADHALPRLALYGGNEPWTGGAASYRVPGWPNETATATEEWAAYVDGAGNGIGAYFPGSTRLTAYRYSGNGISGPEGADCSYFAPVRKLRIRAGGAMEYEVWLRIGSVEAMRRDFTSLHASARIRMGSGPWPALTGPGKGIPPLLDAAGRAYGAGRRPSRNWVFAFPASLPH